jgi:hypothetical protein
MESETQNMTKTKTSLIITITAISLLILPCTSGLVSSTANISFSGVVQYSTSTIATINKACLAYVTTLSDTDTTFMATHFNLVVLNPDDIGMQPTYAQAIKTKNSAVTVLGYRELYTMYPTYNDWAVVNANEAWFLHDVNGNRIYAPSYGWYLMNPGNAGWRSHFVSNLNSVVLNGYDGLFADDVWNALRTYGYTVGAGSIKSSDIANWHSNVLGMLQYVKANIGGKLVVLNTDESGVYDYVAAADGMMIEGYCQAPWNPSNTYSSFSVLSQQIKDLGTVSGMGKIIFAVSGVSDTVTLQTVKYCYAMYLLGVNGSKAYWGFNDWVSSDGSHGYYSIMDTNISSPLSAYYSSQNIYMRDFTGGKVLFNPTSSSCIVNLGSSYKLLNGTVVSSLTIGAYNGEILQRLG